MKKIIFIFYMLLVFISAGVCADADSNTLNAIANRTKLLYPTFDYFRGINVKITGDDKSYSTNDPIIERLLINTAKAKEYLGSYYIKNTVGVIVSASSIAAIVSVFYYISTLSKKDIDNMNTTTAVIIDASMFYGIIGCFFGALV